MDYWQVVQQILQLDLTTYECLKTIDIGFTDFKIIIYTTFMIFIPLFDEKYFITYDSNTECLSHLTFEHFEKFILD